MPTPDNDNPLQAGQQIYIFDVLCLRYSHKKTSLGSRIINGVKQPKQGVSSPTIYQLLGWPANKFRLTSHHLLMSSVCFLGSQKTLSSRIMDNLHSPEENKKMADVVGGILKSENGKGSKQILLCEFLWVRQQIWLFPLFGRVLKKNKF